jgi:hypothetical protein
VAEVKVRVTAQNEVRTGLQQALNDAKQFGQEATRSVTIDEQAAMAPIRKMQSALAEASKVSGPQLSDQQAVKVALEATGLQQLEDLKAALAEADNKVLTVALEASGLSTAEELRDALAQAQDKTVSLALEATGLASVEELRAALDSADNKVVELALEATGLSGAEELRAALDQAQNKSVELALEATGLPDAKALQDAIRAAENKTVELALQATGFSDVQQLQGAIDAVESKTIEVAAENERALAPLREVQAKLREIREQAGQPIQAPAIDTSSQEQLASANVRGAAAIRGLATDLANASGPAQIFEAIIRRISTAMGGLIAATAGFAIGSIIAKTLREAADGVEELANKSQALQTSFANLSAPTTSFDQLSSAIRGAADEIKALQDANQKLQSGIGFQLADYASSFDLSTAANQATESGVNSARINLASAISAAASRELELAQARTDEERKLISLQAARQDLLNQARAADAASGGAPRGGRLSVEGELERLFAAQDASGAAQAEASLQAQADKQRAINEDNRRSLEERLAKEKEIQNALAGVEGAKAELERENSLRRSEDLAAQIASNNERAAAAAEAEEKARQRLAQQAADLTRANDERGLDSSTLLARRQADLAGVRDEDFDNTSEADIRRQQIRAEILRLEEAITAERERQSAAEESEQRAVTAAQERQAAEQKSAQDAVTNLRRLGQTPAERRASIEQESSDLIERARSLAPDDFAGAQEVAAEAGRISSELRGLEPGEFGGASDLQRVGLASREFFNTADDKTEKAVNRANDLVKRVVAILENSDGLYIGRN